MAKIKKIIGAFFHAPDRFDKLAERIAELARNTEEQYEALRRRLDETGEQIYSLEERIDSLKERIDSLGERAGDREISRTIDRICGDREQQSRPESAEQAVGKAASEAGTTAETTAEEDYPEGTKLDIEKIMEEIRAEARRWEPCEDLPAFGNMPKADLRKGEKLKAQVKELTDDYMIPQWVDYPSRNPLKNLYKKIARKVMRCAVAPMSERITDTNLRMKTALEKAVEVIEEQEKRIAELEKKAE